MQLYITITLLMTGVVACLLSALYSARKGTSHDVIVRLVTAVSLAIPVAFLSLSTLGNSTVDVSTTSLIIVCIYTFVLSLVLSLSRKKSSSRQVKIVT